jgi:SNF2 family DNA or RNA helicase
MWFKIGCLQLNNISINNIDKLLIDNRNRYNIVLKNNIEYYYQNIINDPLTIIILHYYLKSNNENKFIDIKYDNEVYINIDNIIEYIHFPIFNTLCHLYIRYNYENEKELPDINNINFIPKIDNKIKGKKIFTKELDKNFHIKLFDYQKQSITRMIDIENNINMTFDRNFEIELDSIGVLWDPHYENICDTPSICHVTTNGGILADSMGLGKTITIIGLMHYGKVLEKINTNFSYSKATLIIVPSHLAKQWMDEYIKAHGNTKKIIVILTKIHHDKTTYNDIINADIVIVTIQFLLNIKNYCNINYEGSINHFDYENRYNVITDYHKIKVEDDRNYLNTFRPLFECFHFNRVIIDEGHEIMEQSSLSIKIGEYISHLICNIKSNYKWYISGTPFTTFKGLINIFNFLDVKIKINNDIIKFIKAYNNYMIVELNNTPMREMYTYLSLNKNIIKLLNTFTIRHLKEDINDIHFLGYREHIEWLELSSSEKNIYDSKKEGKAITKSHRKLLQQICCHPLITDSFKKIIGSEPSSLEDVQDKIIQHHTKNISTYTKKIEQLDRNNQAYHMTLKMYQTKITESQFILKTLENITNINEEESCVICYDNMVEPIMTPCAHLFCENCIKTCINIKPECPMCKSSISVNQLVNIKPKNIIKINNPLIDKYGSKLGKLIQITRTLLSQDSRIIIFSQWDDMLLLIRKSLLENEIDCSFISGNVYKRNKAIRNFKLGNNNGNNNGVILLSLENSASGTNLTEATHIIMVEPIDNTKENIKAIEGQAIGRAVRIGQKQQIEVIRILCKDTIEEEIYNDKYK